MTVADKDLTLKERKAIWGMLSALGRIPSPVSETASEESSLSPEERLAAFLLEDTRLMILSQGWHFNAAETTVSLNTNGEGEVPANTLSLIRSQPMARLQGDKVISVKGPPYAESVLLSLAVEISFNRLPNLCLRYVVVKATRLLQDRLMTSPTLHAFTEREEMEAYVHLKMWEAEAQAPNMLTNLSMR